MEYSVVPLMIFSFSSSRTIGQMELTMPKSVRKRKRKGVRTGKLRIADHWNAISIIAKSQANPLKAVAEFVENSIDARAKQIVIIRGKKKGEFYLKVSDDGDGIPKNTQGLPDFRRVATHICDSIKRQFKPEIVEGIQGEFGIGLLSFWTVGHNLSMTSCSVDGKTYEMTMAKDSPNFTVTKKRVLLPFKGTDLMIYPLLPGLRSLTGEKIQRYLASELRDRIKSAEVTIKVVDRTGRKELIVVPRQFTGRLLHNLNPAETEYGDIYLELYLGDPGGSNQIGLYRRGTRVLPSITELEQFRKDPWTAGYLQGIVDAPFLNLTPGTRQGILRDDKFNTFYRAMEPVEICCRLSKTSAKPKRKDQAVKFYAGFSALSKKRFCGYLKRNTIGLTFTWGSLKKSRVIFLPVDQYRKVPEKRITLEAMILKMKRNRIAMTSLINSFLNTPVLCSVC
jgi:hypothetical protein